MVYVVERTTAIPALATDSLPRSLQFLIRQLEQTAHLTPEQLQGCLQAAQVQPKDLMSWADFAHPVTDGYGRQLVYDGGRFEVMVMSWREGDYSAIHDHGATEWGAVQCFGSAEHYTYDFTDNMLQTLARCDFAPGEIKQVDHDLIHQMGNPSEQQILSLHVYGCDQTRASITGNARIFDLLEQCIQYTDGGVFFGLPEAAICARTPGIQGDRATTLRHHLQMRDRFQRIVAEQPEPMWVERLAAVEKAIAQLS
ncbi:MAG: cysteine dioxygenase [Spirulina sp. SIO3F2]|nr:cysteine dioxygenase [Spirulina sp. SIO3F2]